MKKKSKRIGTHTNNGETYNLEGHFVDYEGNFVNHLDFKDFWEGNFHGKLTNVNPDSDIHEVIFLYGFPVKMTVTEDDGEICQYEMLDGTVVK